MLGQSASIVNNFWIFVFGMSLCNFALESMIGQSVHDIVTPRDCLYIRPA